MSTTRIRSLAWGLLRVSLLGAGLVLVALTLGIHSARAAFGERLLGFGAELSRWQDVRLSTAPRRLSVNGAELELVVATTPLSVGEALNRLERVCERRGGIIGTETLPELFGNATPLSRSWLSGRVRKQSENEGALACLDTGMALSLDELTARLQRFAQSGDLNELGAFRYATARRSGNVTTVLFIWSDGAIPLRQMFPASGDAPGFDSAGVPRPPGSTRLLSGAEHGAPYAVAVYRTTQPSPAALVAWYRGALRTAGFVVEDAAGGALLARQRSRTLLVRAAETRRGVAAAVAELK